jgi:hypothetical protein
MADPTNPFGALTLIVAPAVLTNASSILVLSTSNRLARAIDRARALTSNLELPQAANDPFAEFRFREVGLSEQRALLLLRSSPRNQERCRSDPVRAVTSKRDVQRAFSERRRLFDADV